jgi:hypothetical protein
MPYVEYDEVEAVCPDCGRPFRSEEDRDDHRAAAHEREPGPPGGGTPSKRLPCSVCARSFASVAALVEHNRRDHAR